MTPHDLIDLIGATEDELVLDAKRSSRTGWAKWLSTAVACFLLIFCVAGALVLFLPAASSPHNATGNIPLDAPIMPLTVLNEGAELSAERHIDFALASYDLYESTVTDSYILTNPTDQDQTATLLYPCIGSLDDADLTPLTLSVDGIATNATLYLGQSLKQWSGGDPFDTFADYEALFSDIGYLQTAFDLFPALDQPVIVYRLNQCAYASEEDPASPTIQLSFQMDQDSTQLLVYGVLGQTWDEETGTRSCQSHLSDDTDVYLIVLGEDITTPEVTAFQDGSCTPGEELAGLEYELTRYETTLDSIAGELISALNNEMNRTSDAASQSDWNTAFSLGTLAELLYSDGLFSQAPASEYTYGRLESMILDARHADRVLYYSFEVTVPAHSSLAVEARFPNHSSSAQGPDDEGYQGYCIASQLGSALSFTKLTVAFSGADFALLPDTNPGLTTKDGCASAELDLTSDHYEFVLQFDP